MSTVEQLKRFKLFDHLPPEAMEILASQIVMRQYHENFMVLSQGDETGSIYFINSGKLRVFRDDEQGNEVTLEILRAGDYFGEFSLLSTEPRVANVETLETTSLLIISRPVFTKYLSGDAVIAWQMCRDLIGKLRAATLKVGNFALLDVRARIIRELQKKAVNIEGQIAVEGVSHEDIANFVGASPDTVKQIMVELFNAGFIKFDGRKIVLL